MAESVKETGDLGLELKVVNMVLDCLPTGVSSKLTSAINGFCEARQVASLLWALFYLSVMWRCWRHVRQNLWSLNPQLPLYISSSVTIFLLVICPLLMFEGFLLSDSKMFQKIMKLRISWLRFYWNKGKKKPRLPYTRVIYEY